MVAWWNLGHPWRQGNLGEDEVCQQTHGPAARNFLPDWDKWRLAASDRGLLLNRELWREQMERVRRGLDPVGMSRAADDDRVIRVPSDNISDLTWDEAMLLYNLTPEERAEMLTGEPDWLLAKPKGRGLD